MTVSLNHLSDLVRKRVAVAAYYFVPGVVFASWASRIPDVKQMLHLSNGHWERCFSPFLSASF